MDYLFGIDIGGTTVKIGVLNTSGDIIEKFEITTNKKDNGSNILPDIAKNVVSYLDNNKIDYKNVKGIGFGVPGPVTNNVVMLCVNLGWGKVDLKEEFSKLIPFKTNIACANDANVAAIGEMWKCAGAKYSNAVMLTLGTGVGGGVIVNNSAIDGSNGAGGELGHIKVDFKHNFQCNCGLKGCLETVTSATGVVNIAKKYLKEEKSTMSNIQNLTCKDVFDCAANKDELAIKVVDEVCNILGYTCSILAATTDPEVFIVGGGVSKAGNVLIEGITKYYKEYAFKVVKDTPIMLATLGNDAGMIGAAFLVK